MDNMNARCSWGGLTGMLRHRFSADVLGRAGSIPSEAPSVADGCNYSGDSPQSRRLESFLFSEWEEK